MLRAKLHEGGFAVCAEADEVARAAAVAAREQPDVCLLDGAVAGGADAAITAMRRAAPLVPVVILARCASDAELLEAVAAGARGHLREDLRPPELVGALADVLAGRPAFPRRLEALLVAALRRAA